MARNVLVLLCLLPLYAVAQKELNLTVFGGMANYSGDIQEKRFTLEQAKGAFGFGLSYEALPKVLVKTGFLYGKVGADDKYGSDNFRRDRNLNFQSQIFEFSLTGDYSLLDLQEGKLLTPYVFGGIHVFRFNPYTYDEQNNKVFLRDLGTEGQGLPQYPDKKLYKLVQIGVPLGIGIRFRVTDNVYLGYEMGVRMIFTDYLDDVSTFYADEAILTAARGVRASAIAFRGDELKDRQLTYPPARTKRGSPDFNDWYYFSGLTLSIGIMDDVGGLFGSRGGKAKMGRPGRKGGIACPPSVL